MGEFFQLFNGNAVEPYISNYQALWTNAVKESRSYLTEHEPWNAAYLKPAILLQSANLTTTAIRVASGAYGNQSVYVARARAVDMPTRFVVMLRWREILNFSDAQHLTWPYEPTLRAAY